MKTRSFPKIILTMSALFIFCGLFAATSGAATFTVTNTGDNGGVDPAPGAGTGTLRQAIVDANTTSGADTITLSVTGTILLASQLQDLYDNVVISGPGANALTVKRDPSAAAFRIFFIGSGKTVTISGLTITNGSSTNQGGGIYNGGTLTVTNSTLSGNSASNGGGGIFNFGGEGGSATLTVTNSTLSGNSAGPRGGGILNDSFYGSSTVTVSNSTLSGNLAYDGSGIYNETGGEVGSATVTITNSTLSGNSADGTGGGIYNWNAAGSSTTVTVSNSTFSGNSAHTYSAGGIFNNNGTLTVTNSTFSGNSGVSYDGGGIYNYGAIYGATLEIGDTILKTGASGTNIFNDSGTITSRGYNLSSDSTGPNGSTDLLNTDPTLGPLQNNGGPTFTHALMTGSPAIDKGKNMDSLTTDQRGPGFTRMVDNPSIANATGGDGTDIGAFEVQGLAYAAQIQQPINADGTSIFNVRRGVVPVKFTLTLNGVATCDLPPATIVVTRTAGGTPGPIDELVYTGSADNGSNFRISNCQYIYNLSASALGLGTYQVDVKISGQVVGSGMFQLK